MGGIGRTESSNFFNITPEQAQAKEAKWDKQWNAIVKKQEPAKLPASSRPVLRRTNKQTNLGGTTAPSVPKGMLDSLAKDENKYRKKQQKRQKIVAQGLNIQMGRFFRPRIR